MLDAIIPAVLSFIGGQQRNEASAFQAQAANEFSERMSSTAHQREVADLRAAGLNPILSANRGAPAPQGQQARVEDEISPAIHSGLQGMSIRSNVRLQDELGRTEVSKQELNRAQARALGGPGVLGDAAVEGMRGIKGVAGGVIESIFNQLLPGAGSDAPPGIKSLIQNLSSHAGNLGGAVRHMFSQGRSWAETTARRAAERWRESSEDDKKKNKSDFPIETQGFLRRFRRDNP